MMEAGCLWVAQSSSLFAFLAATRRGRRLRIEEFDVAHGHQGRGVGRRMMAHVIASARAAGSEALSLTTFRNVPWNAPFYESCGFREWTSELPPDIVTILADELAKGLQDRCAMRLDLQRNGGA
jgi:GNAT superfamily N-acetyltransferase